MNQEHEIILYRMDDTNVCVNVVYAIILAYTKM